MSEKMVRMSFTVPPQFQDDLNYISARMGISKSAALVNLLSEPLPSIVQLLREIPAEPPTDDLGKRRVARRFRDSSMQAIEDETAKLKSILDGMDLFTGDNS
jgi:hypothetical protein